MPFIVVPRVIKAIKESVAKPAPQVLRDQLVLVVKKVSEAIRAIVVRQVQLDHRVRRVKKDLRALRVIVVPKVHRALPDHREIVARPDILVFM
jgi:hypothetical protein